MPEPNRPSDLLAVRVGLVYGLVASAWIVFSDRALVVLGMADIALVQTYKGLAFVAFTAGILFFVIRSYAESSARANRERVEAHVTLERLYRLLGEVSSLAIRSESEHEMYEQVCVAIVEAGMFEGAWVMELDEGGDRVVVVAARGDDTLTTSESAHPGFVCELDSCSLREVFESANLIVDNEVDPETVGSCLRPLADSGLRSLAALPIIYREGVVGVLSVLSTQPDAFSDVETRLLERLVSDLSVGVSRYRDAEEALVVRARLESSENRYRELFEMNPRPMWVYDLETLEFLDVNDAAIAHYGYSRTEFLGMTIADIRPAEDVDALLDNVAQVTEGIDFAGLWRHVTRDGQTITVDITSHVLEYQGRRAELVLSDDVTALVDATEELRRTAGRLAALVQTAPVAIIVVDSEARVTEWNPAAERIFGWSAGEVLGAITPSVPLEEQESFRRDLGSIISEGRPVQREARRVTRDGRLLDVVIYMAPLTEQRSEEADEVMKIILDVTARTQAERELALYQERLEELVVERTRELEAVNERLTEATRVKSEFLANMSHELRTPLNSIIGFSGILLQGMAGEITEEQAKQVGMVHRSGKHLLELINDILDLSRIEAGRVSVDHVAFDIGETVASVTDTLLPLADGKGLGLGVDGPANLTARSDRTKVRQILYNLIGNAIKFTEAGHVDVGMHADDAWIEVRVSDTGCGIDPVDFEHIFDEFRQARRGADQKPPGTGLGLAISRKLARMLGGDIVVESTPGEGSVFVLRIPRWGGSESTDRSSEEGRDG